MSLPAPWVDRIFEKLTLTYGRDFLARWEGLPIAEVKADWAEELAGFEHYGGLAIAHALEHLPEKPPSIIEFHNIAQRGPFLSPMQPALGHTPSKAQAEESKRIRTQALAHIAEFTKQLRGTHPDPRAWAHRIVARHAAGEAITPTQLAMAREAIGGRYVEAP
jgi:hypothetical protein